jgi:succinate-semialdehyde dehydrogenase/glutarate-semialdehyde dehydrogenase
MPIRTVNPATGEQLREFSSLGAADIERKLARAAEAREIWSRARVAERARVVRRAGELLDERKERYGRLMTLEMGKTLRSAIEESAKCATGSTPRSFSATSS